MSLCVIRKYDHYKDLDFTKLINSELEQHTPHRERILYEFINS